MVGIGKSSGMGLVRELNDIHKRMQEYLEQLTTGLRINEASDDPAGLVVSEKMRAQISGYLKEATNLQDEISRAQTFEGTAASVQDAVGRINELAVQAANGTLTSEDRAVIQQEIEGLNEFIAQASETTFNEQPIATNLTPDAIGTAGIDVVADAASAITAAQDASANVASKRSQVGAQINAMESRINNLAVAAENTMAAESQIRDADFAEAMINLVQEQIKERAGIAMLAQFNMQQASILKLLE